MKASFLNRATAATIAPSTTFVDGVHPASNVQLFGRPHLRAYSADTSAQRFTLDFGATTGLDVIALLNPNFTTVTLQGHGSDTWGSPGYTSGALTLARSATGRYHHAHMPTVAAPFSQRYLSLSIPNQATTDGAAFFKVGPLWAGSLVSAPRGIRIPHDERNAHARKDLETADGRRAGRLKLDEPTFHIVARRQAANDAELFAWWEFDRLWTEAPGQAALVLWIDDPAFRHHVYVMRRLDDEAWPNQAVWSESAMDCAEVTRG